MGKKAKILWIVLLGLCVLFVLRGCLHPPVRYVAVGDSLSFGNGLRNWPKYLTTHMKLRGRRFALADNVSRPGWTVRDAIRSGVPDVEAAEPNFMTVLIGGNDYLRGMSPVQFRRDFGELLDRLSENLPPDGQMLIVTLPDFARMRPGAFQGEDLERAEHITSFNVIIREEAEKRGLRVFDLHTPSARMGEDPSLMNSDGIHPTSQGQKLWAQWIAPTVKEILP